jgi:adiponectin receptor
MLLLLLSANRIPERFSPGKFDIFFASHQIFHVCVVLAALAHYAGLLAAYRQVHISPRVCNAFDAA